MTDRKKYTQKYNDDAVEFVISSGRPIAQIAPDIGVNEGTLGTWVGEFFDHVAVPCPEGLSGLVLPLA